MTLKTIFSTIYIFILGSEKDFPGDARILNAGCFIALVTSLGSIFSNISLGLPMILSYFCLFGSLISLIAWVLNRFFKWFVATLILLLITMMIILSASYMYSEGAYGATVFFYIACIPLFLFLLKTRAGLLCALVLLSNISWLYSLELLGIIHPQPYDSESVKLFDLFATQIFAISTIIWLILYAKKSLINEKDNAIAANKTKSLFLANINHEVRTPMNAIIGLNELAILKATDPQQKLWLETSQAAAQHLLSLLEDIIDISQNEDANLTLHMQAYVLSETLEKTIAIFKQISVQKNLNLHLQIDENLPQTVIGDPVRLRQVLINLLDNALKFTQRGTVTLKVSIYEKNKNTNENITLLFEVNDSGIGINEDDQHFIFEAFTQENSFEIASGLGLGLSISKKLVTEMGGKIWFDSSSDIGSSFSFSLPLMLTNNKINIESKASTHSEKTAINSAVSSNSFFTDNTITPSEDAGATILLVEDNEINIQVAQGILKKNGLKTEVAMNGKEAVEMARKKKYPLIIMDLEMPIMDGFEATKIIRSGKAGDLNKFTPIIALTAHAFDDYREKSITAKMQGFITKPFDSVLLISECKKFLD